MMDGLHILIVDDSRLIGERLERLLKHLPEVERIDYVESPAAAIDRLSTNRPDLMILDHHFPEGSGEDLLTQGHARRDDPHVIIYSAFGSLLNHARYRELGAHAVIDKNESPEDLVKMVESIIRIRSNHDMNNEVNT
jgi:DNA-binding NarL/FixJ family response regulator